MATVAHWTEAQLAGPKRQPLGGPCHPVRGRARPTRGHSAVHVQCTRSGAMRTSASTAKRQQCLHLDLLHGSNYKPQHRDLGEGDRREVLTGEAVGGSGGRRCRR
jgi:hypothetical protein